MAPAVKGLSNVILILITLKYFCINHGDQRVFSILNHHKCLSLLFTLYLNTYGSTAIRNIITLTVRGPAIDMGI